MNKALIILSTILAVSACHNAGRRCKEYTGILPAADAPGIKTTISFPTASHYRSKQIYIDKEDGVFKDDGRYEIKGNLITLREPGGTTSYYRLEKDQIRRLNSDKQEITGPLADHYVLKCKK